MSPLKLVPKKEHLIFDAFTDFILSREARLCSPNTLEYYKFTAGDFVNWAIQNGLTEPEDINIKHVRSYIVIVKDRGVSEGTIHAHARATKTFLRFLLREGYIDKAIEVDMPIVGNVRPPLVTPEDFHKLMRACRKPKETAVLLLFLDSGMRRGEACTLAWGDINIKTGVVRIRSGKGKKDRSVVIGAKCRRALLKYRRTVPHEPRNSVFNLKGSGMRMLLRRLGAKTNVKLTAHMLRRSFATWSLQNGMSLAHVQGLLGHTSLTMTLKYLRLVEDNLIQAHRQHGPVDQFLK